MIKFFKCGTCKNYIVSKDYIPKCKAFPKGIPLEIFREEIDHTVPYEGDNGIQYESKEEITGGNTYGIL